MVVVPAWQECRAADAASQETALTFGFAEVQRRASELARRPFTDENRIPSFLEKMDYDQYRDIRFREEKALWGEGGVSFRVKFFHRGFYFTRPVAVHIVEDGQVKRVAYSADLFDFGQNRFAKEEVQDLGFAGFQLFYPLYGDGRSREIAAFLGASYFRVVARDLHYGLSARGLAIGTGADAPEEFPFFREFWIEKPRPEQSWIRIYALLDSPSASGAYAFRIEPGATTTVWVQSRIYVRKPIAKLGVAPLTSMFYRGENSGASIDDFRPEVHDSDGLLIETGNGEWIWRPLVNPSRLQVNSFLDRAPRGFGLIQRDRQFEHYQDLEAFYHRRPTAWVEPTGDWGAGRVELVQIPSTAERFDNIVSFWVPEKSPLAGDELQFSYRIHFAADFAERPPGGRTIATRTGRGGILGLDPRRRLFVVDFGGGRLEGLPDGSRVEANVTATSGRILNAVVQKNFFTSGWRVSFELIPGEESPVAELRCFLSLDRDVLTETWSYSWIRESIPERGDASSSSP